MFNRDDNFEEFDVKIPDNIDLLAFMNLNTRQLLSRDGEKAFYI